MGHPDQRNNSTIINEATIDLTKKYDLSKLLEKLS